VNILENFANYLVRNAEASFSELLKYSRCRWD
jgi:hypothetical protein